MRSLGSVIIIFLFIPIFLISLFGFTSKYQLTNADFWLETFKKENVYPKLSSALKETAEEKVYLGGGNVAESKTLIDLINPENLESIFSKNVTNTLDFTNGKTDKFWVYVPINIFPEDLLPESISQTEETVLFQDLAAEFGYTGFAESNLKNIGRIGLWLTSALVTGVVILAVFLFLLFLLTKPGTRLINMGTALLTSGIVTLAIFAFLEIIRSSMLRDWPLSADSSKAVFSTFLPLVLGKVLFVWLAVGIVSVLSGIALFFVRKPVYNIRK